MKGNDEVIAVLQDVLCAELTAINQYFIHARMCSNWGYKRLAETIRKESLEEMHHAQEVIDRILYLDGVPNMQKYMRVNVGVRARAVRVRRRARVPGRGAAQPRHRGGASPGRQRHAGPARARAQREEDHVDWLEAQIGMLKEIGADNYLAQQLRD